MLNMRPLFAASIVLLWTGAAHAQLGVGEAAPSIQVDRWHNLPKGMKEVEQSHLKGKIVIVEFWATWCGPCRASIPHLIEVQNKYKSKGVILLAISDEPDRTVTEFMKSTKMPYVVGTGGDAARNAYQVKAFPTTFLVDGEGKIAWVGHPAAMDAELEKLLKESPPKGKSFLMTGSAKELYAKAESYYKSKKYEQALKAYDQLAKNYATTKEGKESKKKAATMRGNSSIMSKIKIAQDERKADKWLRAARAVMQYGDASDAVKYYTRIIDECPDTKSAKFARSEIEAAKAKAKDSGEFKSTKKKSTKKAKPVDEVESEEQDDSDESSDEDTDEDE